MMRYAFIVGCSLLLWAVGSAAPARTLDDVTVRSGDHEGFSRLVLALPHRVEWHISGTGHDRKVIVKGGALRFDTSTVFDRMRDDRLKNIVPVSGGLHLTLDCECAVEGFWHGQSMLVIDIRDPDVITDDTAERKAEQPQAKLLDMVAPVRTSRDQARTLSAGRIAAELAAASLEQHFSEAMPAPLRPHVPQKPDLSIAREQLARQISRAATMGLLSPQVIILPAGSEDKPLEEQNDSTGSIRERTPESNAGPTLQLRSETSLDRDVIAPTDPLHVTHNGKVCISDDALAIADWGNGTGFANQIGPARARLTDPLGRLDTAAALDLARLYLHHGFGVEAGQVLRVADIEGQEGRIARAIAHIFEKGEAEGSVLAGQLSCASDAAMWSALSYRVLPADTPLDLDAILRGTNALPRHLRDLLAPGLARKLIAAGQSGAADDILRLLERNGTPPGPDQGLARAEVELAVGDENTADETLGKVAGSNTEISAEALLRRIDTRLQAGRAIPQNMADLAGAYAHELRNTEIGHDLARAYIEASAASGAFADAFDHRERLAAELPEAARRHVTDTLFDLLTQNAEDVTFLKYVLSKQAEIAGLLTSETETAIAGRLLEIGFPVSAQKYLSVAVRGPGRRERRLLRAKAALILGEPLQAQVELLGLAGQESDRLRTDARSMAGQLGATRKGDVTDGQSNTALRAMQAEDRASALAGPETTQLATRSDTIPDAPSDGNLLAHGRALIDASVATRTLVADLLGAREIPNDPNDSYDRAE